MRPISLELEGFTCFKQRQRISFDGLELFAIWGPTGAGKTSLLDAIVFALYGSIPRLDEKRNRDIISLTRDKAVVLFEFSAGAKRYRVLRTVRRKGGTEATLEDGDGNPIADGVRGVGAELLKCLGLSYDAFVQAVMLPQGEFARFLKSEPRERRGILRDLLRLAVYERMRAQADQRRRELETELAVVQQALKEYADATPGRVVELEGSLVSGREQLKGADDAHLAAAARYQELKILRGKTQEFQQQQAHLGELDTQAQDVAAIERRIDVSQRASRLMPVVAMAEASVKNAEREQASAQAARAEVERKRGKTADAEASFRTAELEAAVVGPLRERIRVLDGIRGAVEARVGVQGRLSAAKVAMEAANEKVRTANGEIAVLEKKSQALAQRVEAVKLALGRCGYDKALDEIGQRLLSLATALQNGRRQALEARGAVDLADAEAIRARRDSEQRTAELDEARIRHRQAAAALEAAEKAYQAAYDRHAAFVLRRSLQAGELCPVCGQAVREIPEVLPVPELDSLKRTSEEAKRAEAEARKIEMASTAAQAAAQATAAQADQTAVKAAEAASEAIRAATDLERRLREAGADAFRREPGDRVEDRVLAGTAGLAATRSEHARLSDELSGVERDRAVVEQAIDSKKQEGAGLREAAEGSRRRLDEIVAESAELERRIRTVTEHPDPIAEATELDQLVRALEERLQGAKAALDEVRAGLAEGEGTAKAAEAKAVAARKDADRRIREAQRAAAAAGFDTVEAVGQSLVADAELANLRKTVEVYRVDREATCRRIEALSVELSGREVSDEELQITHRSAEVARKAYDEALRLVATLELQLSQTRERMAKREEYAAKQNTVEGEAAVHRQLADELQNNRFQEFVLEEAFCDLTRGASERLQDLTGRYSLRYRDGEIIVVDHDNADEMRSADTLSGGETFLASLALALQLSEQIQQAAGAVLLESLFVDEGFGTLDAEVLDSAASAVESLRGGGRMVGIITHIRELADRLPCRIVVERRQEGSAVQVHVA
jgi:DNA repair protein SbcC/Rad50